MALPQLTQLQKQNAVTVIAKASVQAESKTGVPAEFTTAQCIFESYYLSSMPQGSNNCFGIKKDGYGTGAVYSLTEEYLNGKWVEEPQQFETYATLTDCFADHARLISTGLYAPAFMQYEKDHDMSAYIRAVSKYYATDPNYATTMIKEAYSSTVATAVQLARQAKV